QRGRGARAAAAVPGGVAAAGRGRRRARVLDGGADTPAEPWGRGAGAPPCLIDGSRQPAGEAAAARRTATATVGCVRPRSNPAGWRPCGRDARRWTASPE